MRDRGAVVKELNLQDLLNMADASVHDGICDLWNQKTIHYLVVFTSADADFEIIGVGPTLPCTTLEEATHHELPGKKPDFYIKCPAAVMKRLQPKLGATPQTPPPRMQPMPPIKGRSAAPFGKPATPAASPSISAIRTRVPFKNEAVPAEVAAILARPPAGPGPPGAPATTDEERKLLLTYFDRMAELDKREQAMNKRAETITAAHEERTDALAQRVAEFEAREQAARAMILQAEKKAAVLQAAEEQLREREAYLTAGEEKFLEKMQAHQVRATEVDQIGEELRQKSKLIEAGEKRLKKLETLEKELEARAKELQEREAFVTASEERLLDQANQLTEKQERFEHKEEETEKTRPRASSNTRPALKPVVA